MSALKQTPLRARRPAIVGPLIRRGVRCGYRLCDVLLGQRPSLHDLLQPSLAFVRSLRRYYAVARLPATVHVGLIAHRLLPPIRLLAAADGNRVSRFSRVKLRCMHGVLAQELESAFRLRRAGDALALAHAPVLPSGIADTVG